MITSTDVDEVAGIGKRVVFVCGLHRSGTSFVHRCLANHPDISGFRETGAPEDEGQHLQTVYPPADRHGGPGRFGFDPASHLTEASPLVTSENRRKLIEQWSAHWDMSAPLLIEKSPPNLVRIRFLRALFPGCRFVIVIRHPAVVACATERSSLSSRTSLVHHWVVCHEIMRRDIEQLEGVHQLRYEELMEDVDKSLAAIQTNLGLAPAPTLEPIKAGLDEKYFRRWVSRRWYDPLRLDATIAIRRFEGRVRAFGYSLVDLEYVGAPFEPTGQR